MSLKDDLDAATREAGGPANQGLDADGVWSTIVPVDGDSVVPVRARVTSTGRHFTLVAHLADLTELEPELLVSLLRRNAEADHTDGATYAVISEEDDIVAATCHWTLPSVSPLEFAELLQAFAKAVRILRNDLTDMADQGAPVRLLEPVSLAELAARARPEPG